MATILMVEDEELIGESLKDGLEDENFQVHWAQDGEAAFEILDSILGVDLILLDIMLPGQSGYQILQRIRTSDKWYKEARVVMLTNLGQIDEMDQAMELGASDYIIKSNVDLNRVVEIVKEKLSIG